MYHLQHLYHTTLKGGTGGDTGLSELFQVSGCDEKVGGCKSRRGKTLGGSGGMPTGKCLNLESLKWHFLHFQKRFINQVF